MAIRVRNLLSSTIIIGGPINARLEAGQDRDFDFIQYDEAVNTIPIAEIIADGLISIENLDVGDPRAVIGLSGSGQSSNLSGFNHVEWNTAQIRGDRISLSSGTGQQQGIITLQPGHTYRVNICINLVFSAATATTELRVFDRVTQDFLAPDGGVVDPRISIIGSGAVSNEAGSPIVCFEFTPTARTDFDVQISSILGGAITLIRSNSWMTVDVVR